MKLRIENILKENKLKVTEQRMQILSVLKSSSEPLSSEDIFFNLRKNGLDINLSTVYRTLEKMVGLKIVDKSIISGEKSAIYSLIKNSGHHHYIKCTECGKITPITNCPFDEIERIIEKTTGYTVEHHDFSFSGKCGGCA